jgi:hypothetical protein
MASSDQQPSGGDQPAQPVPQALWVLRTCLPPPPQPGSSRSDLFLWISCGMAKWGPKGWAAEIKGRLAGGRRGTASPGRRMPLCLPQFMKSTTLSLLPSDSNLYLLPHSPALSSPWAHIPASSPSPLGLRADMPFSSCSGPFPGSPVPGDRAQIMMKALHAIPSSNHTGFSGNSEVHVVPQSGLLFPPVASASCFPVFAALENVSPLHPGLNDTKHLGSNTA